MNYEVNLFQDYESITVDELKDQANSLLNLVTEEQRPLRVCMNNGKEFLLFPQDLLALICDSDFRLILLSAMRYAMGRNTCMPMVVADYIKRHIQLLDDKFLVLAADEIRRHLEDYAEHEPNPNLWHDLLGALETEQRERATRKARKIRLCPACGKPLEVMSIADNQHSPGGFDVIAHCRNCLSDYEWFCDKDGGVSDMKQYFFGYGRVKSDAHEQVHSRISIYFPLKCPSNYGNAIVIEGKQVSSLESKCVMVFFVYSAAASEPSPSQKPLAQPPAQSYNADGLKRETLPTRHR